MEEGEEEEAGHDAAVVSGQGPSSNNVSCQQNEHVWPGSGSSSSNKDSEALLASIEASQQHKTATCHTGEGQRAPPLQQLGADCLPGLVWQRVERNAAAGTAAVNGISDAAVAATGSAATAATYLSLQLQSAVDKQQAAAGGEHCGAAVAADAGSATRTAAAGPGCSAGALLQLLQLSCWRDADKTLDKQQQQQQDQEKCKAGQEQSSQNVALSSHNPDGSSCLKVPAEAAAAGDAAAAAAAAGKDSAGSQPSLSQWLRHRPWKAWRTKAAAAAAAPAAQASPATAAVADEGATDVVPLQDGTEGQQQQQQEQVHNEEGVSEEGASPACEAAAVAVKGTVGCMNAAAPAAGPAQAAGSQPALSATGTTAMVHAGPGPLIANKASLPRSTRLPPIAQRPSAPLAWSALPSEVTSLAYAVTAPLSVQPLPLPHTAAAHLAAAAPTAVGAWAELPGEVSSIPFAAQTPVSKALLEPPPKAAFMAVPPAVELLGGSVAQQQQQQQGARAFGGSFAAHAAPRYSSDPGSYCQQQQAVLLPRYGSSASGCQPQVPLQQQQLVMFGVAADVADLSAMPLSSSLRNSRSNGFASQAAAAGATENAAAAAAGGAKLDLPPSVQQLHETVMARLRAAQIPGSQGIGGGSSSGSQPGPAIAAHATQHGRASSTEAITAGNSSSRSSGGGGGASKQHQVVCEVPCILMAPPCEVLPSPRSLLHQQRTKEATVNLIKELVSPREHSKTVARTAQLQPHDSAAPLAVQSSSNSNAAAVVAAHQCCDSAAGASAEQQEARADLASASGSGPLLLDRVTAASGAPLLGTHPAPVGEGTSSRPGSRASDVCSIVRQAKQRAAARQRLPLPAGGQQQQLLLTPRDCSSNGSLLFFSRGTSPCSEHSQPLVAASSRALSQENSGGSVGSAGLQDGEHAMRMLQDYRVIAELDAAIKARVSQLSSAPQPHAAGAGSGSRYRSANGVSIEGVAAADAIGDFIAAAGMKGAASAVPGRKAASGAAMSSGWRAAAVTSPESDTNIRSDSRPPMQQWQQRCLQGPAPPVVAAAAAGVVAADAAAASAFGLLGIKEALDNSYDAGKNPGAAATAKGLAAVGANTHGSYADATHGGGKQYSSLEGTGVNDGGYRNPFISPATSPSPDAAAAVSTASAVGTGNMLAAAAGVGGLVQQGLAWGDGGGGVWGSGAGAGPALAVAGRQSVVGAASRDVDQRIRRIVLASRARAEAAAAAAAAPPQGFTAVPLA